MTTPRERRLLTALRFIASCPAIYTNKGPTYIVEQMRHVATETVTRETSERSTLLHLMKKEK